jgi:3'(2'), 5'-bisphosphate nucleotidase
MNSNQIKEINNSLLDTFKEAGNIALELRKKGLKKEMKSDNTPVTNGDIEVNNILTKKISSLTPQIPIISEETSSNKKNKKLENFWLIDPIDGTESYINNRDEFTLNAALIINKKPLIGIINAAFNVNSSPFK